MFSHITPVLGEELTNGDGFDVNQIGQLLVVLHPSLLPLVQADAAETNVCVCVCVCVYQKPVGLKSTTLSMCVCVCMCVSVCAHASGNTLELFDLE